MRRGVLLLLAFLLAPVSLSASDRLPQPLRLPPGLVQVLPINKESSYFGDAARVVNCTEDRDNPLGTCGNLLFGGLALMQSHLSGRVQIKFYPPVGEIAHFEISHPGNLRGDDTVMKAPQFFAFPVRENFVMDPFGEISSGNLNLVTGEVTNLQYKVFFLNSFYDALSALNTNLRGGAFGFPGFVGSAKMSFSQRSDGLLDFTIRVSTFLPLGKDIHGDVVRFPLPLCGPLVQCAGVPASGTSLHPYVNLSSIPPEGPGCGNACPDIPTNTIREFTVFTPSSTVGDTLTLNIPELGGPATGVSHLIGRIQIQFGERSGDSVPVAISSMPPEGLLAEPPAPPPIPGMSVGLIGHNTIVDFPRQRYRFNDVLSGDDPFDLAVGSVNLKTGRIIGEMNIRELLSHNVLQAVVRLNPGLPSQTFRFPGPAFFEKGVNGQTVFRFRGEQIFPFVGLIYPTPDLVTGWVAGPDSQLEIFYRIQAMHVSEESTVTKSGSASDVTSATGDRFSYRYSIRCGDVGGKDAVFEYTNNNSSKGGTFRMHSLAAVSCLNSRTSSAPPGDYDSITFTGYGTWSRDNNLHAATVSISTSQDFPMVTVKIDAGLVSDASTKSREAIPLP